MLPRGCSSRQTHAWFARRATVGFRAASKTLPNLPLPVLSPVHTFCILGQKTVCA
jgi:hypothetical protein